MATNQNYTPTQWVDHYQDPVTGEVLQQGTSVNAEKLNKMEEGIADAFQMGKEALPKTGDGKDVTVSVITEEDGAITANLSLPKLFGRIKKILSQKVDIIAGKGLSTNDFTTAFKTKLEDIAAGATNYTHPSSHPATMITTDASKQFVTNAEKQKLSSTVTANEVSTIHIAPNGTIDFSSYPNNALIFVRK